MTFSVESVVEKTSHGQPDPHRSGRLAGKEDVLYVEGLLKKTTMSSSDRSDNRAHENML